MSNKDYERPNSSEQTRNDSESEEENSIAAEGNEQQGPAGQGVVKNDSDKNDFSQASEQHEADGSVEIELSGQIAELKDQLLRAMAETENIRRRSRREVEDTGRYAIANFARDMLGVGDNLRRALESIGPKKDETDPAFSALIDGVELTERELLSVLDRHNIKSVSPMGERFDPKYHQAMIEVESNEQPAGTVVEVIQPGYVIGDRLLRPAMVGVAKKITEPPTDDLLEASAGQVDTQA